MKTWACLLKFTVLQLISLAFFLQMHICAHANVFESSGLDPEIIELFIDVNKTIPAQTAADAVYTIIEERILCFEENFSYRDRVNTCMNEYRNSLLKTARQYISGRPETGRFLKHVSNCPIMHNLCKGQSEVYDFESNELCMRFERQCVDLMFDRHWRGSPIYENIEVGIE